METPDSSKPSRYRSLCSAPTSTLRSTPSVESIQDIPNINRSRSRYRNNKVPSTPSESPAVPPAVSPISTLDNYVGGVQLVKNARDAFAVQSREYLAAPTPPIAPDRVLTPRADAERKRRLTENGATRQNSGPGANSITKEAFHPSAAPRQILSATVDVKQEKSASCFGGLFRRRKQIVHQQPEKPTPRIAKEDHFIKQGGGGVVPGIDAPKSAVNSGERRVLVECNVSAMQFPVDLDTTAADLLQSAANCFSEQVDPKTFVVVESFGKVGIQRPLRRFEHIRDIMNSWDDDVQNSLIVMPAIDTGADPALLHVSRALPPKQENQTFSLFYSQKVGKWDRRFITLRPDGQIVAKKSLNGSERDTVNVCHLSDFDIYTPTIRQVSKKIRPPKTLCFAVKSQQKSSMFESAVDFVHFFSTSDKQLAIDFYMAVQGWRSWYLVDAKGDGTKRTTNESTSLARGLSTKQTAHARHASNMTADSRHHIGAFKPLIAELPAFDTEAPMPQQGSLPTRRASTQRSASRPQASAESGPLINHAQTRASLDSARTPFAPTSLLGRTYSQRQPRDSGDTQQRPGTSSSSATRTAPQPARFQHAPAYAALTGSAPPAGPVAQDPAFVPGGLVETSGGWGSASQGRGVQAHAEGPLVSLRGHSGFVAGSLLAKLEQG